MLLIRIVFALMLLLTPLHVVSAKPKPQIKATVVEVEPAHLTPTVPDLIRQYSSVYGISPDLPLRIAKCESGYNPLAKNKGSTASGVFQYLSSTWKNTPEGRAGLSVFDAEANVRAGVRAISVSTSPWNASRSCWQ